MTRARRLPLSIFALPILVLSILLPAVPAKAQPSERPNVVLIFADDLGYGDLSSYGHPTVRTPNLDHMAADGIRMTSFYVAAPSCTPSRAALLTGRYPLRSGLPNVLMPDSENGLPDSEITLPEALKEVGYRTAIVGKWHLGHEEQFFPTHHGFDHYYGLIYSNDMIPPWVQTDRPLELYRDTEPIEHPVDQSTLTARYTDEAIRFIESAGEDPFFLYLAHSMPHLPVYASEEFEGRSRAGLYGDVIEEIDAGVGRIVETLRDEGLEQNTLVIFTSDNGPWLNRGPRMLQGGVEPWDVGSPGPLRGSKGTTYEAGMRVPFIATWPGDIPAGRVSAEMATTMDLYTTILTAAGGAVPADRVIDGNDIMPLLRGQLDVSPTQVLYYFNGERLEAVREGAWKFRAANAPDAPNAPPGTPEDTPNGVDDRITGNTAVPELFDLDVDPAERHNVVTSYPDVAERLKAMMIGFGEDISAAQP